MISRILIIASGGLLCYTKTFGIETHVDSDLVSGFLTAISNFAKEIKGGEIKSLNFRNFNFLYEYDQDLDCMFVIIIDIEDLEDEARNKLGIMKNEFLSRYRNNLNNWTGDVTIFKTFDQFVDEQVFIPPKILLVGEPGVGKSTIMALFPGESVIELDEDLNQVIQKPINVEGLKELKQFILREENLEDLVDKSKIYRPLLNSVDVICVVTNSGASNLSRTKNLFGRLKSLVKKPDFYLIANFQDLSDIAFEPIKIEESFGVKTYGFSATSKDARIDVFKIFTEMLKISILDKMEKRIKSESKSENKPPESKNKNENLE